MRQLVMATMVAVSLGACAIDDGDLATTGVEESALGLVSYDPFNNFNTGNVDGQGGWIGNCVVTDDEVAPPNKYLRCRTDALYDRSREAELALLRPLFITSFLIDDFLADNGFFGAATVLLSSASSKTAYGTAFCLAQRRGREGAVKIVGLTSPQNVAFTEGLGCFDHVLAYDAIDSLPADVPSVYVDMSGSAGVRAAVHGHFGDALRYSCRSCENATR